MTLPPELNAAIDKAYADGSIFSESSRPTDEEIASAAEHVDKIDFNEVVTTEDLIPTRMSSDDGLAEAVQRVMAHEGCSRTWDDLTRVDYCPAHNCGWLSGVNACAHAEAVTQAAREDVADLIRRLVRAEAGGEAVTTDRRVAMTDIVEIVVMPDGHTSFWTETGYWACSCGQGAEMGS